MSLEWDGDTAINEGFADFGNYFGKSFPALGKELFRDGDWSLIRDYRTSNGTTTASIKHDCPHKTKLPLYHAQSHNGLRGFCGRCGMEVPTPMVGLWRLETWER